MNVHLGPRSLLLLALASLAVPALGSGDSTLDTDPAQSAPAPATEAKPEWFQYRLSYAALVDYSFFRQDAANIAQVGKQDNTPEIRDLRITASGTMGIGYKVGYQLSAGFNGLDYDHGDRWSIFDLNFSIPVAPTTKLIAGKTKETFVYEMVSAAAYGSPMERVLNPFFNSRNIGLKVQHYSADKKMTASGGVFNDWFVNGQSLSDSGTTVTGRVTFLPQMSNDGADYTHLGLGVRYAGADNGTIRLRGRPESNVTDFFVDTGKMNADNVWNLGLEFLWNRGPLSFLGEYAYAKVSSSENGNPNFSGYYITASYFLTGEHRPYDPTVGYTRAAKVLSKKGAFELVGRFSSVDLDDAQIQGGSYVKTYLGANWWAQENWKIGAGWGHTWLDRADLNGQMDAFHFRLQWLF